MPLIEYLIEYAEAVEDTTEKNKRIEAQQKKDIAARKYKKKRKGR